MRSAVWGECCGGWGSGAWCASTDGMPACKIACRMGPSPQMRCNMDFFEQDASKRVRDGVPRSVSYFAPHFKFIHLEHF